MGERVLTQDQGFIGESTAPEAAIKPTIYQV